MFTLCVVLAAVSMNVEPVEKTTTEQIRQSVQRSLPYIEEKGDLWIRGKKCVSCHRVGTMLWSLEAAQQQGFKVSDRLDEWRTWAEEKTLSRNDSDKIIGLGNKEGVAQLILGKEHAETEHAGSENRKKLIALLRNDQQPDGSWKPGGQLPFQKRALSETADVSTLWLTLALKSGNQTGENREVIQRAMKSIEKSPPGKSTEWYAVRLLLAIEGTKTELQKQFVKQLKSQQNPDGGWAWLLGQKSDALGTGLALYALVRSGVGKQDASVSRARQFLLSTQLENGSWAVLGTKEKKKDSIEETAVYWGTTWAVIALVSCLEEESK